MINVFDGAVLWGNDAWAAKNRPDLAHAVDANSWMERIGRAKAQGIEVRGGLAMPFPSTPNQDFISVNRAILSSTGPEGPARILSPILAVRPDDAKSLDDLDAALSIGAPVGIKLWPYMGGFDLAALTADTALVDRIMANRLIVLVHVGNGREMATRPAFPRVRAMPTDALACARELSDVPFIIGHVARLCPATLAGAAETPNVMFDLSGLTSLGRWQENGEEGLPVANGKSLAALGPVGALRALVKDYGLSARLIFGTTWPFCTWWGIDLVDDVALVEAAGFDLATRTSILTGTLSTLIACSGPIPQPNGSCNDHTSHPF